jgi:hypothetical protein
LYRSANLTNWTYIAGVVDPATPAYSNYIQAFEFTPTDSNWHAMGYSINNSTGYLYRLYGTSTDGTSWTFTNSGTTNVVASCMSGTNMVWAGATVNNQLGTSALYSIYGTTNSPMAATNVSDSRSNTTYPNKQLNGVAFGNGVNVLAGNYDFISYSSNIAGVFTNVIGTFSGSAINGLAFGNGIFVASTTDGKIATSTDGATWTLRTTVSSGIGETLTFAAGTFVLRNYTKIYYSTDGVIWNTQDSISNAVVSNYAGTSTTIVAALSDGRIFSAA